MNIESKVPALPEPWINLFNNAGMYGVQQLVPYKRDEVSEPGLAGLNAWWTGSKRSTKT
jgi:hypothetical protein